MRRTLAIAVIGCTAGLGLDRYLPVTHAAMLGPPDCIVDAECEDDNPCTADVCLNDECLNVPVENGIDCSDGIFCNGPETCQVGQCRSGELPCPDEEHCDEDAAKCIECLIADECDDGNPCTFDVCTDDTCNHRAVFDGTPCPDSGFCNGVERCFAGVCTDTADPCDDLLHCDEQGQECLVDVRLEWRPAYHFVGIETPFEVGLYAVPIDILTDTEISAVQTPLMWDANLLEFGGYVPDNPDFWLSNGMPMGTQGCGFNSTFSDGDAYFRGLSNFAPFIPVVSAEGFLIGTFTYRARTETMAAEVSVFQADDLLCQTIVASGTVPGLDILASIGTIRVRATETPIVPGDADGNHLVDLDDYSSFFDCVSGPGGGLLPDCEMFDFDIDLDVDEIDFGWLQRYFD